MQHCTAPSQQILMKSIDVSNFKATKFEKLDVNTFTRCCLHDAWNGTLTQALIACFSWRCSCSEGPRQFRVDAESHHRLAGPQASKLHGRNRCNPLITTNTWAGPVPPQVTFPPDSADLLDSTRRFVLSCRGFSFSFFFSIPIISTPFASFTL